MEQAVITNILKYLRGQESPEELKEVLWYLRSGRYAYEWEAALEQHARAVIDGHHEAAMTDEATERLYTRIHQHIVAAAEPVPATRPMRRIRRWLSYAAAAVLAVAIGSWLFFGDSIRHRAPAIAHTADVAPGGNHARITLADGRVVDLDSVGTGWVAVEQGMAIRKDENGLLTYEVQGDAADTGAPAFNTITTPRGGQYQVLLPDGTRVWLNAASTLRYPLHFDKMARVVELEGEGYFEVRRVTSLVPFLVKTKGQTVEVLGTQFGISAYADEPAVKTTLVEGSVRVTATDGGLPPVMLEPGQQSTFRDGVIHAKMVDVVPYVAWKDGLFAFHNLTIHDMIRQIERWYDVQFDTSGMPADNSRFSGEIGRDVSLSKLLDLMSQMAAPRYTIEGRRVIVHN